MTPFIRAELITVAPGASMGVSPPALVATVLTQSVQFARSHPDTPAQRPPIDRAKWAKLAKEFNVKAEN